MIALPLIVLLFTVSTPLVQIPPPTFDEFPKRVLLLIVTVAGSFPAGVLVLFRIAPPKSSDELLEIVLLLRVRVAMARPPTLKNAPPEPAILLENVLSATVTVPSPLATAPPYPSTELPVNVLPL